MSKKLSERNSSSRNQADYTEDFLQISTNASFIQTWHMSILDLHFSWTIATTNNSEKLNGFVV